MSPEVPVSCLHSLGPDYVIPKISCSEEPKSKHNGQKKKKGFSPRAGLVPYLFKQVY